MEIAGVEAQRDNEKPAVPREAGLKQSFNEPHTTESGLNSIAPLS